MSTLKRQLQKHSRLFPLLTDRPQAMQVRSRGAACQIFRRLTLDASGGSRARSSVCWLSECRSPPHKTAQATSFAAPASGSSSSSSSSSRATARRRLSLTPCNFLLIPRTPCTARSFRERVIVPFWRLGQILIAIVLLRVKCFEWVVRF